jgi:hypothetical protein
LVNFLGIRAPYTNDVSVVDPNSSDKNGVWYLVKNLAANDVNAGDAPSNAAKPLNTVTIRNCFINSSEKGLGDGGGGWIWGVTISSGSFVEVVDSSLTFLVTPITDPAVVSKVK